MTPVSHISYVFLDALSLHTDLRCHSIHCKAPSHSASVDPRSSLPSLFSTCPIPPSLSGRSTPSRFFVLCNAIQGKGLGSHFPRSALRSCPAFAYFRVPYYSLSILFPSSSHFDISPLGFLFFSSFLVTSPTLSTPALFSNSLVSLASLGAGLASALEAWLFTFILVSTDLFPAIFRLGRSSAIFFSRHLSQPIAFLLLFIQNSAPTVNVYEIQIRPHLVCRLTALSGLIAPPLRLTTPICCPMDPLGCTGRVLSRF